MPGQELQGPFCQSCGMPLENPEDFGTSANGSRINDYCRYCFQRGAFTEPDMSMEGMIDRCVMVMAEQGIMPEAPARALMRKMIPRLKRWERAKTGV
jgi:hypothetical protein